MSEGLTNTSASRFVKLRSVGFNEARWTGGFWGERFAQCRDVMVPTMRKLMTETERPRYVGNFEVAIGAVEGKHRGPRWDDGDFYKWLESAAASGLGDELDEYIDLIARAQDDDGYIHTDVQIAQRTDPTVPRFGNPMDFEMYNMGHLITAACVHHRATGKTNLLSLARKAADFLAGAFANPSPAQARHGICPSHLMALVELYRTTREQKYLDLAVKLLNMRDLVTRGDDDNQDRIPFREQTTAHGHAVRATYLYAGAADIYSETGDTRLLEPLEAIWHDLVSHKLYITGGCGALYDGASPDGAIDQTQITRVHQAFGRNYQLPQSTAHNETCAAIGNLMWNWRMLLITGESRFADLVEHTLFNSVLAGISLNGTKFFYTNTLRQLESMPCELRWPRHREKTLGCFCCPPNVVRTIAESANYAYALSDQGVSVILYGSNQLRTEKIKLSQETNYPWDGDVRFTIESAGEFAISLRIPAWAKNASISINGKAADRPKPGAFHTLRRRWNAGDVIELHLPMPVRVMQANPLVEEARNQVAVMRGPLVYCLESADLPGDVRLLDVHVKRNASFTPETIESLLPDLVALRTRAIVRPSAPSNSGLIPANSTVVQSVPAKDLHPEEAQFSNGDPSRGTAQDDRARQALPPLYHELSGEPPEEIDLRLIPYFAWDNRGEHEMSVWLPLS